MAISSKSSFNLGKNISPKVSVKENSHNHQSNNYQSQGAQSTVDNEQIGVGSDEQNHDIQKPEIEFSDENITSTTTIIPKKQESKKDIKGFTVYMDMALRNDIDKIAKKAGGYTRNELINFVMKQMVDNYKIDDNKK